MTKNRLAFLALAAATAATASFVGLRLDRTAATRSAAPAAAGIGHADGSDAVAASIDADQAALKATPGDAALWASLGSAYVEQGRATADPSYYPKADGSLHTSLTLQADGNLAALRSRARLCERQRHMIDFIHGCACDTASPSSNLSPIKASARVRRQPRWRPHRQGDRPGGYLLAPRGGKTHRGRTRCA